ncbi:hypothetical protein ABXJ56_15550 [Microbacterium chocolatum]|uniref:hypothetical protein n=1 Tax=Microbacterium aurantiacum TaxID=162393 RepID=UPI00338D4304
MRLLPILDSSGKPSLWINADHLVSVQAVYRGGAVGIALTVELKVDGMPLQRISLGEYRERAEAEAEFDRFLSDLQHPEK